MTLISPDFPSYTNLSGHYRTLEQLAAASDAELIAVKGVGAVALNNIRRALEELLPEAESPAPEPQEPLERPDDAEPAVEPDADPESQADAPAEPKAPPAAPAAPTSQRVTVLVGRLYYRGRFYARGDTVVVPVTNAQRLIDANAVR